MDKSRIKNSFAVIAYTLSLVLNLSLLLVNLIFLPKVGDYEYNPEDLLNKNIMSYFNLGGYWFVITGIIAALVSIFGLYKMFKKKNIGYLMYITSSIYIALCPFIFTRFAFNFRFFVQIYTWYFCVFSFIFLLVTFVFFWQKIGQTEPKTIYNNKPR